ncbi:hypothetical protein M9Y10_014358 [Tritrichomonas musculus]|uniref:Uncharacterized protein n=1 Tax=Tritrichomonas musculus TaxID=1915356 RepID=A0ABR2KZI0_9EUKA
MHLLKAFNPVVVADESQLLLQKKVNSIFFNRSQLSKILEIVIKSPFISSVSVTFKSKCANVPTEDGTVALLNDLRPSKILKLKRFNEEGNSINNSSNNDQNSLIDVTDAVI